MALSEQETKFVDDLVVLINGTLSELPAEKISDIRQQIIKKISELDGAAKLSYQKLIGAALNVVDDTAHLSGNDAFIKTADKITKFYSTMDKVGDVEEGFKALKKGFGLFGG